MITYTGTSEEFNQRINETSRQFRARITAEGMQADNIMSINANRGSIGGDSITIGSAVSQNVEIIMEDIGVEYSGKEILLEEGMILSSGNPEYVPIGRFTVTSVKKTEGRVTISAYDVMATKTERLYVTELTNTSQIMNDICTKMGITFVGQLEEITLQEPPAGYTIREIIGYIAGLYGKFAIINRDGNMEFKWFTYSGYDIDPERTEAPELQEATFVIRKISCHTNSEVLINGSESFTGIETSNPFMTQTIWNAIWTNLQGFTYLPGKIKLMLGDMRLDPWDMVKYKGAYMICGAINDIYDGGLQTTITSIGQSEAESTMDSNGPTVKKIERIYEELISANKILANTLTVESADIRYLKAEKQDIIQANIESAVIANLEGAFASIDYLKANYADVNLANVQKESVGTLLANVGLISSATITDGHVTGFLDSVQINANSITAGTLDAGVIDVTNLNAANITVGTINGYQIAPGAIDMDNLAESVTGEIDSANTNAQSAFNKALEALDNANSATGTASTAKATADGKNTVFYQASAPSGTHKTNDVWFDTDDYNKMYYWNGSAWTAKQFGTSAIASQSITNALIKDATIDNAKISNLDAGKLTTGILDADRIGANTITANKLIITDFTNYATANENFPDSMVPASTFGGTSISDGYIVKPTATNPYLMLCDYTPCNFKSGEQIYYEMLIKGAVSGDIGVSIYYYDASKKNIVYRRVTHSISTEEQTISGTLTISDKGETAIYFLICVEQPSSPRSQIYVRKAKFIRKSGGNLIVDGAITTAKLAANAVTAATIASGAITTDKLAANAVTATKIATRTITADRIVSGAITANEIAASAITTDKLTTNAVTADKIDVTSLSAISANIGTVTAGILKSANYTPGTSGMQLNLASGTWDSCYFKIDSSGKIASTGGKIAGFEITENGLFKYRSTEDQTYISINSKGSEIALGTMEKSVDIKPEQLILRTNESTYVLASYVNDSRGYVVNIVQGDNITTVEADGIISGHCYLKERLKAGEVVADGARFDGNVNIVAKDGLNALVVKSSETAYVGSFVENAFDKFGIYASESENTGLFNHTKTKWLIREDKSGNVFIPHPLNVSGRLTVNSGLELSSSTPYIDFHYGSSTEDYTSRIIETAPGFLAVKGCLEEISFKGAPRPIENATSNTTGYFCGAPSYKWRAVYSYNSTIQTSDRNEKHNIDYQVLEGINEIYDELKPCSYIMNGGERTHFGFIAQDCEEAIQKHGYTLDDLAFICRDHEYVEELDKETKETIKVLQYNEDGSPKYIYGLRYSEIVPLNTMQIQKLKKENKELKNKVRELETQMEEIKKTLEQIVEQK